MGLILAEIFDFDSGALLYAANLNIVFAMAANVAGDTIPGNFFVPNLNSKNLVLVNTLIANTRMSITGVDISSGLIQAKANANTALNLSHSAYNQANTIAGVKTITYMIDSANQGLTVNTGVNTVLSGNNALILASNAATTIIGGVVQLNDTVVSSSVTQAATIHTANVAWATAQAAFLKANTVIANANITVIPISQFTVIVGPGLTVNNATSQTITNNATIVLGANAGTTTTNAVGMVQLIDSVTSKSTSLVATANAIRIAYSLAANAVRRSGDTMTGKLFANGSGIGLEVANNANFNITNVTGAITLAQLTTGPIFLNNVAMNNINVATSIITGPLVTSAINVVGDMSATGNINSSMIETIIAPNTTYVLTTNDSGATICFNNSSPTIVNVGPLPVGFRCVLTQINTGNVTIQPNGITISSVGNRANLAGIWSSASLVSYQPNQFILDGSLI